MNKDAVQHERGPRNSTLRRQMAMLSTIHSDSTGPASTSNNSSFNVSPEQGFPTMPSMMAAIAAAAANFNQQQQQQISPPLFMNPFSSSDFKSSPSSFVSSNLFIIILLEFLICHQNIWCENLAILATYGDIVMTKNLTDLC